jgi:hypothetical protein
MKKRVVAIAGLCAMVLAMGLATKVAAQEPANVAGTWEMSIEGRRGTMTQTLTIQQDGGKIKGTLKNPRGESNLEGAVEGNKIHFTVKRETPRGEFTVNYTGTVDGSTMKGKMEAGRFGGDWTAKKQ